MKTRQCIFIDYGQDEFGFRFYDPIVKKFVRRDIYGEQTIQHIEKVENSALSDSGGWVDFVM